MRNVNAKIYEKVFLDNSFKNKWYYSFILRLDFDKEINNIVEVLNDIFITGHIIKGENELLIIYFDEVEFSIEEVILSISDDFGINTLAFMMPKMYFKDNKFFDLYDMYDEYLSNKHQGYYEVKSLVLETLKNNIIDALKLKKILLEKVLLDMQNENILVEMFENDLNVVKTSKKVYMHRNTINNKLDMIRKETGMNIQKFEDAVAMYLLFNLK